jgi:hypothetical protein
LLFLSSYQGEGLHRPWNWIAAAVSSLIGYRIVEKILTMRRKSVPNDEDSRH